MSWLWGFFSREWSGLVVAAVLCGGGFSLCLFAVATWQIVLGLLIVGDGLVIAAGSTRNLLYLKSLQARHPPPGRLIDIGGYAVHLLAEGGSERQRERRVVSGRTFSKRLSSALARRNSSAWTLYSDRSPRNGLE